MPVSLTSNSISGTYLQLLHIGDGTPGVARVKSGNGTDTALEFVSGGTRLNGTLIVTGNATMNGSMTVVGAATFGGAVAGLNIPVFRRVTSDVIAPTTTQVAIDAFNFTPVSGAVYRLKMDLLLESALVGTGPRLINTGGVGELYLAEPISGLRMDGTGSIYGRTDVPLANTLFGACLHGVFLPTSTAVLQFSLFSENAATAVKLRAGSILEITRLS